MRSPCRFFTRLPHNPGSPPRLRGIPRLLVAAPFDVRFTPAPAGNTGHAKVILEHVRVHPRACGEYALSPNRLNSSAGSPPRLRGIRGHRAVTVQPQRFTPAPAGNTSVRISGLLLMAVHPRACGEYRADRGERRDHIGSPPRLRGIRSSARFTVTTKGFTPAPAGNTPWGQGRLEHMAVHPRACGEYSWLYGCRLETFGSPPRLRGIPRAPLDQRRGSRFTPAPAGNTTSCPIAVTTPAVHPRACGEYDRGRSQQVFAAGSPPRLRGIRVGYPLPSGKTRFTPAPAGNTHRNVYMFRRQSTGFLLNFPESDPPPLYFHAPSLGCVPASGPPHRPVCERCHRVIEW